VSEAFRLFPNPRFRHDESYPDEARAVVGGADFEAALGEVRTWPEYAETPLHELVAVARECGVERVTLKDESGRFGLGSFKAIGGAYGAMRVLCAEIAARHGVPLETADLRAGTHRALTSNLVLACATDGNHGRAVAWAARAFGCHCEVFVPDIVSRSRRQQIEALGARVSRVAGTYDDALRALAAAATEHGWAVVSDQAYPGHEATPRDIMQGYAIVAHEALAQWDSEAPPTHVFVQAGVGGFAAAVCGHLWEHYGAARPRFVCVEPLTADCLYRSAVAGRMTRVPGDLATVMACLSCGEASSLGWEILDRGTSAFLAVSDEAAIAAMKCLAFPGSGQPPLVAGESGAAGLAGLMVACAQASSRRDIGLDERSRILLFATEGATDPQAYGELVGALPDAVVVPGGVTKG